MEVRVGCCGWCVRGGKQAYFKRFGAVEVQETFYKLPRPETARRWREQAPDGFVFTMKAWQAVTHPPTSPTWRRAGVTVPKSKQGRYGFLRPTDENLEAWERSMEVAEAMDARVVIVQTPASFGYSRENAGNVEEFFSTVKRGGVEVGWEPRGTWREHLDEVKRLCDRLDLIHVVDPFRLQPVSRHPTAYYRLHGIGGKEVNYSYKYTAGDLKRLLEMVEAEEERGRERLYVMFNNVAMAEDARRFKRLLSQRA